MAEATVTRTLWVLMTLLRLAWHHPARASGSFKNAVSELWRNRLASVGALMVLTLLLVALLAPFIARYDPVKQNYREMLQAPVPHTGFGTDKFGRDIWSRVVWGAQRSVIIACWRLWWALVWGATGDALGLLRRQAGCSADAGRGCLAGVPGDSVLSHRRDHHPGVQTVALLEHRGVDHCPGRGADAEHGPSGTRFSSGRA